MASKARFGRLPRSAPSLTSTIVSLAQEYQHTRDRNIEDAWKQGGLFEGKKVTDDMFLNHWRERLKGVSQDDPMWDYYNNLIYQYNFTIDESKMGQKYAENKVSDGEMAAFYRKWAAKMPRDSENYRQLMTQAAKFKSAANARGRGAAANASAVAYGRKQQDTFNQYEAPFDAATNVISRFAEQRGYLDAKDLLQPDHGWSKLTEASAENDPENFAHLLSDIMADKPTRDRMTAYLKQVDPDFNGVFDEESMSRFAQMAGTGARIRADRAHKMGDIKGEKDAKTKSNVYSQNNIIIRAVLGSNTQKGFIEENEKARATMDAVLGDATKTPSEQRDAVDEYQNWLGNVGMPQFVKLFPAGTFDPFSANYNDVANGLVGRMSNTMNALSGKPTGQTLKDDLFGFSTAEAGGGSDAAKLGEQTMGIRTNMADVDAGGSKVIKVDAQGRIDPQGTEWGIFKNDDPDLADREVVPFAVPGDNFMNGEVRYTATEPVRVAVYSGIDPNTGGGVGEISSADTSDPNIGSRIEITGPGGQSYTLWGVTVNGGEKMWTVDNPFTEANKGVEARDERGNWVVGYVDPAAGGQLAASQQLGGVQKPSFNPSSYVNQDQLKHKVPGPGWTPVNPVWVDSTDNKPWDPSQDKEMGFYSPMTALSNSSEAGMKWVNAMGTEAVAKAEREWYTTPSHWTPDMKARVAAGAKPGDVIEMQARSLQNDLATKMRMGFTPEQQQASRTAEAISSAGRASASQGFADLPSYQKAQQVAADKSRRDEIAARLDKWGGQNTVAAGRYIAAQPGGAPGRESAASRWISKGWTIGELLNQPGMSVEQADDLAAIISGGAVGHRIEGQTSNIVGRGGPQTFKAQPKSNPFAPNGAIPVKPPAPKYVTPKPPPPPKNAATGTAGIGTQSYVPSGGSSQPPPKAPPKNEHGQTEF